MTILDHLRDAADAQLACYGGAFRADVRLQAAIARLDLVAVVRLVEAGDMMYDCNNDLPPCQRVADAMAAWRAAGGGA